MTYANKRIPTIGVLVQTLTLAESLAYGIRQSYYQFAQQFGNVVFITPDQEPEDCNIDLLILPGGADLSLAVQDKDKFSPGTGKDDPAYTYFAHNSLSKWRDNGTPLFGICLGFQMLMNMLGGRMTADIKNHDLINDHTVLIQSDKNVSGVTTKEGGILVNSRHHQGFYLSKNMHMILPEQKGDRESATIIPLALSYRDYSDKETNKKYLSNMQSHVINEAYELVDKDTLIEAFRATCVYGKHVKIAGVQWHPEDLIQSDCTSRGDEFTKKIIKWLLSEDKENTRNNREPIVKDGEAITID